MCAVSKADSNQSQLNALCLLTLGKALPAKPIAKRNQFACRMKPCERSGARRRKTIPEGKFLRSEVLPVAALELGLSAITTTSTITWFASKGVSLDERQTISIQAGAVKG